MLRELIKGRLFGHPVHPMLVHFPSALFPVSFVFDLWGILGGDPVLFQASLYCMSIGLLGGLAAAVFGAIDYVKLTDRPSLFRKASWHAGIQVTVIMVFGTITGLRLQDYPDVPEPGTVQILVIGLAVVAMLIGNYKGGDLVYRDHVGIQ